MKAVVVAADMITPYGKGIDACWFGIHSNRTAIRKVTRFKTSVFQSEYAGTIPGLAYHGKESLVMQMLRQLFESAEGVVPPDSKLMLASTKGEIDLLEMTILGAHGNISDCSLERLLPNVEKLSNARGGGLVLSAACTSSSAAAARAAALIRSGHADSVLVVACDSVTEFVYSGFSSLMALDAVPARPFDKGRSGLSLGEAAAYALVMSEERAKRENRRILGEIAGWGMSDDANHMTGPSRHSEGLILAVTKALKTAGRSPECIGFFSAHGTGTVYNDQMEMRAFRAVCTGPARPVYSIKGGIGHTMGAAGLVEVLIALKALREGIVPPTINMTEPDADARGWVSNEPQPVSPGGYAVVTNAGFSGINTALVLA